MNPVISNHRFGKRLAIFCVVMALVFSVYTLVSAVNTIQTTGTLRITTSSSKAILSISQSNSQAAVVGTGSTSIHLKPGSYTVFANSGDKQAVSIVRVYQKQVSNTYLGLIDIPKLPSVDNIDFRGIGSFIDSGLSSDQVNALKQAFFNYKNSAHIVSVDTASIAPGPRDPDSADPSFIINFRVSIDSKNYKASIRYADLSNVQLYLYDQTTNVLLFDSGPPRGE